MLIESAISVHSVIEHVARICSLSNWRKVVFAMVTAAIDCSQDGARKYFIMAALVSSSDEWASFDKQWRQRLTDDGLPYFHMQPFAQSFEYPKKPFDESWVGAARRRERLLGDLLDIIAAHTFRKVGCIVPVESLLSITEETRRRFFPSLIATAARLVWPDLEIWRRRSGFQESVRLVFEDGDSDKGTLIEAVKEMTGRTPNFEYKKDDTEKGILAFTPLQASDILAYETQKITSQDKRPWDEVRIRYPYTQLEKIPGDIRMLQPTGAQFLDQWLKVYKYFDENPLTGNPITKRL